MTKKAPRTEKSYATECSDSTDSGALYEDKASKIAPDSTRKVLDREDLLAGRNGLLVPLWELAFTGMK